MTGAKWIYLVLFVLLLLAELCIALYVHDGIVRPYIGDYLVVVMLYCLLRALLPISVVRACCAVLLLAYLIELLQYLQLLRFLGLAESRLAHLVLGSSFAWLDMLAYTAGIATVWLLEKGRQRAVSSNRGWFW